MSLWKTLVGRWGSGTGEVDDVRIDASTNSLQTISYEHHEVHAGSHYTCVDNATLNAAEVLDTLIYTPNTTKYMHLIFEAHGALHTQVDMYEGSSHNASGSKTCRNNNRNYDDTPTTTLNTTALDGSHGTNIYVTQFGIDAGGGANRVTSGGAVRGSEEWILKPNERYLVRVTSLTASNPVSIRFSWYEHADKH